MKGERADNPKCPKPNGLFRRNSKIGNPPCSTSINRLVTSRVASRDEDLFMKHADDFVARWHPHRVSGRLVSHRASETTPLPPFSPTSSSSLFLSSILRGGSFSGTLGHVPPRHCLPSRVWCCGIIPLCAMELYIVTTIVAIILGAFYWFYLRDDGAWDANATVELRPIDYGMTNRLGITPEQPVRIYPLACPSL